MAIGVIKTQAVKGSEILNYSVLWPNIPEEHRNAFVPGTVKKVQLPRGFALYKLTDASISWMGRYTPWWSPIFDYGFDPGLEARMRLANHLGAPIQDLVGVFAAVKENWNALTFLMRAELTTSVYAWWGQCSKQTRRDHGTAAKPGRLVGYHTRTLPGFAWQFYIPNLSSHSIVQTSQTKV